MKQDRLERPYPLRRLFVRIVLPGTAILLVVSATLAVLAARRLAEGVYLEQAFRRAEVIDRAMEEALPGPWLRLKRGELPVGALSRDDAASLIRELDREVRGLGLKRLKIYAAEAVIAYSTDAQEIGTVDRSAAYVAAAERGERTVVAKTDPDGSAIYELYVVLRSGHGPPLVFELYETVEYLNALLWTVGVAAAAGPLLIFVLLVGGMARIVVVAQRDIDVRAGTLADLRTRLERLVSGGASRAVRRAALSGGEIASQRMRCTLMFCDVRDFTSFAESNEPEAVVQFLNRCLGIVVASVIRGGGDVDKLVGDAVLARFQGAGAEARAVTAAQDLLRRMEQEELPRGVGAGVFTGDAILGVVGADQRMDFTIIGDSVNVAARLCGDAARGEVVVDSVTVAKSDAAGFGESETLAVKGRRDPIVVRRWSARVDAFES